jgi:hypothetical protein
MLGTTIESMTSQTDQTIEEPLDEGAVPLESEVGAARPMRVLCPYCGSIQRGGEQCVRCKGLFEPLSRQATQNVMGPWQVRDEAQPFLPGVSHERIREMVSRGKIHRGTVLRGPTSRQFWSLACNTQGVAVLLGECHNCHAPVPTEGFMCKGCGAVLTCPTDRQHLGLGVVRVLPGEVNTAVPAIGRPVAARPDVPPTTGVGSAVASPVATSLGMLEAIPAEMALQPASRRRAARDNRSFVPAMVVIGLVLVLVLWGLTARRTPLDGAIEGLLGVKGKPAGGAVVGEEPTGSAAPSVNGDAAQP